MTHKKRLLLIVALTALLLFAFQLSAAAEENKTVAQFTVEAADAPAYYLEGQPVSLSGYRGIAVYSDGSHEIIPAEKMQSSLQGNTVVFTYTEQDTEYSATYPLTVLDLSSLSCSGQYKTDYYGGMDLFNPSGLHFTAVYSNGKTGDEAILSSAQIPLSAVIPSVDLTQPITSRTSFVEFSYTAGAHTVSARVPVKVKAVEKMTVKNAPSGTYFEGTHLSFDPAAPLLVEVTYAGETVARAVPNPNIPGITDYLRPDSTGKQVFTVRVDEKTQTFPVNVIALKNVTLSSAVPFREIYLDQNEIFRKSDFTVTAEYADGSVREVTADALITGPEDGAPFTAQDTVSAEFAGRRLPLDAFIKVHSAAIEVLAQPAKTTYKEGEQFQRAGLIALVRYDDGKTYNANQEIQIPETGPLRPTDSYVTLFWRGLEYRLPISVLPKKSYSLSVLTSPDKVKYVTDEPLSLDGMTVQLWQEGESTPMTLTSGMYVTIPAENTPVPDGTTEILIRYYLSDTVYYETRQPIEVEVKTAAGITVSTQPLKTRYNEGESFEPDGLTLNLQYSDGTAAVIEEGFEISEPVLILSGRSEEEAEIPVTVTYGEMKCVVYVTVNRRNISRLEIGRNPDRQEYAPGDTFDPTGMEIVVYFAGMQNEGIILPSSFYTCTPTAALTTSDSEVLITFRDKTVACPIYVTNSDTPSSTPSDTGTAYTTADPEGTAVPGSEYSPEDTTAPETQPKGPSGKSDRKSLVVLWIVIIAIIVAGLVVLFLYYRHNFT